MPFTGKRADTMARLENESFDASQLDQASLSHYDQFIDEELDEISELIPVAETMQDDDFVDELKVDRRRLLSARKRIAPYLAAPA